MSLFQSKAPAAQDALTALLNGIAALSADEWTGSFGPKPGVLAPEPKSWLVDEDIENWKSSAPVPGAREETFTLRVWFHNQMTGATPKEVRDSVFASAALFEAALGADPTLSGLLMSAMTTGNRAYGGNRADATATAHKGTLRLDVECRAHLSS